MLSDLAIDPQPPIVTPDTSLTTVLVMMHPHHSTCALATGRATPPSDMGGDLATDYVLVMAGTELCGILTVRDLVRCMAQSLPLADVPVTTVMQAAVMTLRRSQCEDVFSVINLFKQHPIRHLPILDDNDRLLGVATPQTLRRALQPLDLLRWRRVEEGMTRSVVTAGLTDSLQTIIQRMAEHPISCVVITEGPDNPSHTDEMARTSPVPLGMITEQDVVQLHLLGLNLATVQAQAVMSSPVFTLTPADSLWQAHTLMQAQRVRRLAVIGADGGLMGLVTQSTILHSLNATVLYDMVQSLSQRLATLEATTAAQLRQKDTLLQQRTEARDRAIYQQQQAITALEHQNEYLTTITSTIPGSVYQVELDRDGQMRLTYLSAGIEAVSGYPLARFQADPAALFDLIHPDDRAQFQQRLEQAQQTLAPLNHEFRIVTATGAIRWVEDRASYTRLPTGEVRVNGLVLDITDLKQMEQSLEDAVAKLRSTNQVLEQWVAERTATLTEQNQKLEAIFQALPDMLFRLDAQGRYLEVKCQQDADLYVPAATLLGQRVQEILPSPVGRQIYQLVKKTLRTQQIQRLEYRLLFDDIPRYFEARCSPLGSQQVIAIVRNISDRKLAELEVRRNRDLFEGIFAESADAIFIVDINTWCITQCNRRAVELFEVDSPTDLIGKRGTRFHAQPLSEQEIETLKAEFSRTGTFQREFEYLTQKGNRFWGNLVAKHLQVASTECMIVRISDITERRVFEQTLQEQKELLREVTDQIPGSVYRGILHPDQTFDLLFISRGVETLTGLTLGTVLARPQCLIELVHPDDRDSFYYSLVRLNHPSQNIQREYRIIKPTGEVAWIRDTGAIVPRPDGSIGVTGVCFDISDRKRTEQTLQRQAEQDHLLAQLFFRMRQTLNLADILQATVEEVRRFLAVDRVLIYRFQANWQGEVLVEAVSQADLSLQGQAVQDPCFPGNWVEQYQAGRVAVVADVQTAAIDPCYAEFLTQFQIRANLVVPILYGEQRLWGLLIAHHCTAPRLWPTGEVDLLRQIAGRLGTAIQQADLYARLQAELAERRRTETILEQQIRQEKVLHALSQQIRQSLDLDHILATTVREIHQLLQADRVLIFRLYPQAATHVIQEAVTPGLPSLLNLRFFDESFLEACMTFYRQGQARIVPNVLADEWSACIAEFMQEIGVKSRMVAPILLAAEETPVEIGATCAWSEGDHTCLWGLLIVHACHDRQWQYTELNLLQRLATQVGIAIQQANLYSQLANELSQKEVLLKEIHHRVKNNLQIISSLLSWQVDMIEDPQVLRIIQDSQNRISAMAMIHERMYQSSDLAQMAFDEYLHQLVSYAFSVYGRPTQGIQLSFAIEPIALNLETALPCGLIAYELVTNALEHAFPEQRSGTVQVTLARLDTAQYQLTVQDDGVGFPADLDFRHTNSMGLQLVCGLTQQIKGTIALNVEQGTQFQLTFAEIYYERRA